MGKIFYIMGKSASGKDTIFKRIRKKEKQLKTITLYTTRPIRENEKQGEEYFFVTEEKMDQLCKEGKVIEKRFYNTIHGIWYYFTVNDGQIDLDKNDYIMIGTLESYEKMKEYFGEDVMVPIYIEVEDGQRLSRALERERLQKEPKYEELCRRFLADAKDFSEENLKKAGISDRFFNENIEKCTEEIILCIHEKL